MPDPRVETCCHVTSHASIARIFIAHRRQLLRIAQGILGCPARAEDAVHDAYIKLYFHTPEGPWLSELRYVCRVVRNLSLDDYRRQQVERRMFTGDGVDPDALPDINSPDRIAIERQREQSLRDAMRALPPRTRDALEQYYFDGQTQRTIATRLGVSPAMVSSILRHGRDKLCAMRL